MKAHTTAYKEQIKEMGRELDSIITIESTELGAEQLNSVTPSFQSSILKSVMKQLEIDSNVYIPSGTNLNYKFGVKINGDYEYLDFGNYIVKDVEKQEDTNSYKITCYDKMLFTMRDYVKMPITYPITIRDYINSLCAFLGLKFANKNDTFVNYNKEIPNELYLDEEDNSLGYTFRDAFDELAQVTASTICINDNDEVEIRYINDTEDTIDEEFLKDINVNFGEKYGKINSIVLSRSGESDNIYLQDEASVTENGLCELKIIDNQIMNFNNRDEFLPEILGKLNGLEYYLNDFSSTGICYYDLCDKYNVKIGDKIYSCIMFNDEINVTQGLEEIVYAEMPEQSETDYTKADKTDRKINQTYIIADKQQQQIDLVIKSVKENSQSLENLKTTDVSSTNPLVLKNSAGKALLEFSIEGNAFLTDIPKPDVEQEIQRIQNVKLNLENDTEAIETTINLNGNVLGKVFDGTVDKLFVDETGKTSINKKIKTVILNGNENWRLNGENTNYGTYAFTLSDKKNGVYNIFSNRFEIENSATKNCICGRDTSKTIVVALAKSLCSYSVDSFKDYLSNNNIVLDYESETEELIEFQNQPIPTFEGDCTITIETNIEPINPYCKYYLNNDQINYFTTKQEFDTSITLTDEAITNNTKQISEVVDSFGNYYNIEQVNDLIQNAESGLTNTFTQSGGYNLLRNTAPWFMESETKAEFWNGDLKQINEQKAVSGFAILTQSGTASQSISLTNGNYSVSFKYKKLIEGAECSVRYNGKTFNLIESEGEIHSSGEIATGKFVIEIIANSNNGFEIYDLILKNGIEGEENMLLWTQNANESRSDTVNISKGIAVSSSTTNTNATMNTDGFKVRNKTTGISVMEATSTGGLFNDITSTGKSNLSGLLIRKVGTRIKINGASGV